VFFSSRMFDRFSIGADKTYYGHRLGDDSDWVLDWANAGTTVFMELSNHTSSSLLKIQSSSVADSVFHVYTFGAEVVWIVCDAINWRGSRPLVMLEPSGFAIGRGCRRLP
jgi:hypothetical protein